MTDQEYDRSQEADRLDTRRGLNDHDYLEWIYEVLHPDWRATPEEFGALVNFTADQLAVWSA